MEFRAYQASDAKEIINWIKNEREFRLWSADRYKDYPLTFEDINNNYELSKTLGNFYPMTLTIDNKIVGHLILRNVDKSNNIIRLGFIIVDHENRGQGIGKKLILEAINYAKDVLGAEEINLGVFDVNKGALYCYKACGFQEVDIIKNAYKFYDENWNQIEMVYKK